MMAICDAAGNGAGDLWGAAIRGVSWGWMGLLGEGRAMRYLFGDYVQDTQRAELHGAGAPIKLRHKAFQVLAYLLAHRDRVVPKHELLERSVA